MKYFPTFIIQIILFFAVFFSTIFFPLYFLLPIFSGRNDVLLGVLIAIVAVFEVIIFVSVFLKSYLKPIEKINEATQKLSLGDYDTKVNLKGVDSSLKLLSLNVNNVANQFESLEQMRKSFVANASHELRSPLTSIQGFLQAMLDGTIDDKDRNHYLEIVLGETKRLGQLINSMLDLSRLESGATPLNLTDFDVNVLINQVAQKFEPSLKEKNINLYSEFVGKECFVNADRDKITQVLINLVDNAIKYSAVNSQIAVTTHSHAGKLYVNVQDHGEGISKKDQMLIWDRFYMTDKARTPNKNKGTGLGLSIVKKIINDHNEIIWVDSSRGVGSTFIFTLALSGEQAKTQPADNNRKAEVGRKKAKAVAQ